MLLAKGLWGHVDGSKSLATDADAPAKVAFKEELQKTFALIVMAISTSQLYLITSYDTPKDAWTALCQHFERGTLANKLFLKKQYFRTQMVEGTSISEHLKRMKEMADKLAAIGSPIAEEDQVVTLLGSLPDSFSTLVTALEAQVDDVGMGFVQQALLNEELKRSDGKVTHGKAEDTTALVAMQKTQSESNFRKQRRCFICNSPQHLKRQCPHRYVEPQGSQHRANAVNEEANKSTTEETEWLFTANANAVSDNNNNSSNEWLIDSGASSHMTNQKESMVQYTAFEKSELVKLGDGRAVEAVGYGDINLQMLFKVSDPKPATLTRVLYVPDLSCNLFSVRAAVSKGSTVKFAKDRCWIRSYDGELRGVGNAVNKLYVLNCRQSSSSVNVEEEAHTACAANIDLWHQRLGHVNEQQLQAMLKEQTVEGIDAATSVDKLSFCESCVKGKITRKPFPKSSGSKSTRKLQLIHSDICGPMQTPSLGGSKYFITFIDDYSRCCTVYFIRHKSEALEKFKAFEAAAVNRSNLGIVTLRTDNGGEYLSKEFSEYLKEKGIAHECSVPYTPEQNGVAERMNRTLVESARTMLKHARLSNTYWAEAVSTAAYIRNRLPSAALDNKVTPYELWYGSKPNVRDFRVFGCAAFAHVTSSLRQKLDSKAIKVRFLGYSKQSKGYRLLDESRNRFFTSRDVIFNEFDFDCTDLCCSQPVEKLDVNSDTVDTSSNTHESTVQSQRRSSARERHPPTRYGIDEFVTAIASESADTHTAFIAGDILEPTSLEEATNSEHAHQWKAATNKEYQSLVDNNTWSLVELPKGENAIGCKWVFKVKRNSDGKVDRFKARLVAKGYAQRYGVDYDETFAPVVRYSSIRAILAHAVQNDLMVHQMDVETAFLNGELNEDVYMLQPAGFEEAGKESMVCKLEKSLYGLKQSPRCWNHAFNSFMDEIGFQQNDADPCVYTNPATETIVAVYVDDLILVSKSDRDMSQLKEKFKSRFKMKDMGEIQHCLGISINKTNDTLEMQQKHYIQQILNKYRLTDANTVSTPADKNVVLCKDDGVSQQVDAKLYQSMTGSLLYIALGTRPDIAHAVSAVAKFNCNPNSSHLTAVKRIFRYLKGTINHKLQYNKSSNGEIVGYSDADYAGDIDNRHSTSGQVFMLAGAAISWMSKKQPVVALSTTEAEYIALCSAAQEAVWLKRLLKNIRPDDEKPVTIHEDNQGTIAISANPIAHARTKHIDVKYHYVREAKDKGDINIQYCPTEDMIADIMTKTTSKSRYERLRAVMGVVQ